MDVIEEIRSGNKETIKDVYKENVRDVYNFAKSITGSHESALEATKKTFVILFGRIQKGETPTNIRLAALKIAYDEACAIAMPSTEAIDSPYDKSRNEDEEISGFEVKEPDGEKEEPEEKPSYVKEEEETEEKEVIKEEAEKAEDDETDPSVSELFSEEEADESEDGEGAEDEDRPSGRKKGSRRALLAVLIIINIILVLILAWFVLGLLQSLDIIPENIKMGHQWFNEYIYPLF